MAVIDYQKSLEKLLNKINSNEIDENPENIKLKNQIDFLKNKKNLVKSKVNNNQWYSTDYKHSWDILDELRKKYATKSFKEDDDEYDKKYELWLESEVKSIIEKLSKQIKNDNSIHLPIVWGKPNLDNRENFVFKGESTAKAVYVPFKDIHLQLANSNCIMRAGKDYAQNYLLAHIVFIVGIEGGRTFIDFPIVSPDVLKSDNQNVGFYPYWKRGCHSEPALTDFLKKKDNISFVVSCLKSKLTKKCSNNFKVYAVILFINSQKNICSGCEKDLYSLMTDHTDQSFLGLLKNELNSQKLKTRTKNNAQHPYMFITISTHQLYTYYCKNTSMNDAESALINENETFDESNLNLSINIKDLAGRVILSTAEKWLDGQDNASRCERVLDELDKSKSCNVKIPYYTGFRSAAGDDYFLTKYKLQYDTPSCFDGETLQFFK